VRPLVSTRLRGLLRPSWPQPLRGRRCASSKIAPGDFVEPLCCLPPIIATDIPGAPVLADNQPKRRLRRWYAKLIGSAQFNTVVFIPTDWRVPSTKVGKAMVAQT
jgi:hypothetical protein